MKASRNTIRLRGPADVSSPWDELKERARTSITNDKIARNGLAFAGAVSMCYVAARLVQGVQGYVAYAY